MAGPKLGALSGYADCSELMQGDELHWACTTALPAASAATRQNHLMDPSELYIMRRQRM
jgi:hypothetical protein